MPFSQSFEFLIVGMLAVFAISNPITSVPLFLSHTPDDPGVRRKVAIEVGRNVFLCLSVTLILGALILDLLQISVPALRCAGGLVVVVIGFKMLFQDAPEESDRLHGKTLPSPSFVPLTIPSLAGPGAMSVVMEGATRIENLSDWTEAITAYAISFAIFFLLGIATAFTLRWADPIARRMGSEGLSSFQKVSGFLFICIGMQIISGGVFGFIGQNREEPRGGQIRVEASL